MIGAAGLTVGTAGDQTVITKDGITTDKVTVGNVVVDSTTDKISGLAAGSLASGSTEAVNGGQINTLVGGTYNSTTNQYENIGGTGKDNINDAIQSVSDNGVQYDKNTDGSTNYNSITAGNGKGTTATIGTDPVTGNSVVTSGGTTISNVANGVAASDAVNKGQLDNVSTGLTSKGLDFAGNSGSNVHRNLGQTLDIKGGFTGADTATSNENVKTVTTATGLDIRLAKDAIFDSITAGNSKLDTTGLKVNDGTNSTVIGAAGLTITGGPSVTTAGINAGNKVITNVAAGSLAAGSTEAITGGQLHKGLDAVKDILGGNATNNSSDPTLRNITMSNIGGTGKDNINDAIQSVLSNGVQYDKNADGSTNYNSITAGNGNGTAANSTKDATTGKITTTGGTSLSNVASAGDYTNVANASKAVNAGDLNNAVTDATNAATTKGFALQAADGSKVQKNLGEAVEVVGADSNITTKVVGGKVAIELNKNLNNLTGITVNNGTDGMTGSTVIGKDGISVKDNAGKTIAGVDNTALTVKDSSGNAETSINKAINILNTAQSTLDNYAVKYDDKSGTPNKDSVTFAGTTSNSTKDATTGKITTTGGTSLNNVASAGDYTNVANASKAVNAGDLNNAVVDATGNIVNKGFALTAQDGQTVQKKLGESVEVVGDDKNISTEVKNGKIAVKLADNLNVNSLTTGNTVINNSGVTVGSNVTLGNTGLIITNGPSVTTAGINAGSKQITNVANGVNSTDAVNKGQLDTAITDVQNKVDQVANNAVQYDNASKDSVTLTSNNGNGTKLNNVADGSIAQGSKDAVNGGQLWNVQQQITNINNGTSGLVQQADKNAPITVGKDTGGTTVDMTGTEGARVVTGVKDGAVNATSTDAVNGSQLNKTNQTVVDYLGGGAGYDNITGSFTAPTYNVGGNDYKDVGGAIDALNQADQTLNTKIDNVNNKLDNAFRVTNNRIDDVEKKANAGIAAALAMEAAPYVPGKYTYAAGAAYHGGENAVGVTLRKTADNGRWSITGGVAAASEGDPSVRIGISGVID